MGDAMPERAGRVCPDNRSKMDVSAALAAGWARVIMRVGRGAFADRLGIDAKTVARALTGETVPELHTALNAVMVEPTALDEVMSLYGLELRPREAGAGMDMAMIADLARLTAKWVDVMADGVRDHRETLSLAEAIRPMMPGLTAILAEADALRGAVPIRVRKPGA